MSAGATPSGREQSHEFPAPQVESDATLPTTVPPDSSGKRSPLPETDFFAAFEHLFSAAPTSDSRGETEPARWLDRFLGEPDLTAALRLWVRARWGANPSVGIPQIIQELERDLALLDELLQSQVNAIIHHPRFQQLEASWRGLWYLVEQAAESVEQVDSEESPPEIQLRVLTVSKRELWRDFDLAVEFDQSELFKKIYEAEFGTAGGTPYGTLIGDYQFTNHPEDIDLLRGLAGVAAAAFAPLITAAAPELVGLDEFGALERPVRLSQTQEQVEYLKWNSFRRSEDARFVGLTLPRTLMRVPYEDDGSRTDGFRFHEDVEGPDRSRYLWGNASYAFGGVIIRAFANSRWFADIRGVERGVIGGGLVPGLPVQSFGTDRSGVAVKYSTEVAISSYQEKELSLLGYIPLCHCEDSEFSAFYTNNSTQRPEEFSTPEATANARISAMLQYVLCTGRFAHYLKGIGRTKLGSLIGEQDLQRQLNRWISAYVAPGPESDPAVKARFPLRQAEVEVREILGQPGSFRLIMQLWPHFQLDGLTAALRLTMKMAPTGTS